MSKFIEVAGESRKVIDHYNSDSTGEVFILEFGDCLQYLAVSCVKDGVANMILDISFVKRIYKVIQKIDQGRIIYEDG